MFLHGAINTTVARAKAVTPLVEKLANNLITKPELMIKRRLQPILKDRALIKQVYDHFRQVFGEQSFNFTKTNNVKYRQGDDALIVKLSFVKPYRLDLTKPVSSSAPKEEAKQKTIKVTKKSVVQKQ